jgi:hypothetical protein
MKKPEQDQDVNLNKESEPKEASKEEVKKEEEEEKKVAKEEDEYIKGPDKFPLNPGRWGYLPMEMQTILHEINAECQISKTNTNLKDDHPCLLRHGIEINQKQSFIACISDALFFGKEVQDESGKKQPAKILSINEMRERIKKAITIDSFIKYQNGNLVTDFHNAELKVNLDKYNNTKLYSKLDINKEADKAYYTKVVSAFENFKAYLSDNDAFIDHTYLWDIISMPNKYLFPSGVNLVIFNLPKDDITKNNINTKLDALMSLNIPYGGKPVDDYIFDNGTFKKIYRRYSTMKQYSSLTAKTRDDLTCSLFQ